jgi:opacity protein-like surface antigen
MTRFALAAALALGALTVPAFAADLIVDEAPAVAAPVESGLYVQLLGGAALAGTLELSFEGEDAGEDELPAGGAVAGVVGFGTGIDGLSIEADAFYTQRDFTSGPDAFTLTTAALMADLKYTVSLSDAFGLYGAVGVGGMFLHTEDDGGGTVYADGWGAGYLLKAGVTAQVADNIGLVGEVRYTDAFAPIASNTDYNDVQSGTAAVLAGLQIGF